MKLYKPKFWTVNKITALSIVIWPLSLIYKFFFKLNNLFKNKKKFSIPSICVGNIYLGGTGKTPLAIRLFQIFKNEKKPIIIKKDYKDQIDEINLIKKYAQLITCKNRQTGIGEAIKKNFNLAILDDGFQDANIEAKINIICFNLKQKIGNGLILPAGPLRQSLEALRKSDLVLINGKKDLEFEQILTKHNQKIHIFYFKYILNKPAEYLNKKLIAFAGIGNPENFFDLLKLNGLNIVKEISFPDHHKFSNNDLNNLLNLEKTYNAKLVTTEKDYLRINSIERRKFGVIPIKIVIDNEENLAKILRNLINK